MNTVKGIVTSAICCSVMVLSCANAHALTLLDDFNDGNLAGWTALNGSLAETGGQFSGSSNSLATMDGQTGSSVGADVVASGGHSTSYLALVLNYNSLADNLFVKLQDTNSSGLFDTMVLYHGHNSGSPAIVESTFFSLTTEVGATYFEVTDNGNGTLTASVDASGDVFDGTLINAYTGTGVGLGFFGNDAADNFYAIPEPSTLAFTALALLSLGITRRKRQR